MAHFRRIGLKAILASFSSYVYATRRHRHQLMRCMMRRNLVVASTAVLLSATNANAVVLNVDPVTGKLLGASDILVTDLLDTGLLLGVYTVEFIDGTCIEVFTGCDDAADFDFDSDPDATNATLALDNQVLFGTVFDSNPALVHGCGDVFMVAPLCAIHTPYRIVDVPLLVVPVTLINRDTNDSLTESATSIDFDMAATVRQVWARWTRQPVEVTEPGTLSLLGAVAIAVGLMRRRRSA